MPGDALFPPRRPVVPPIWVHRCPACSRANLPVSTDADETQYWVSCPECGFEGRFPVGTRSVSRVRRWISNEMRGWHRRMAVETPLGPLSRSECGAEDGGRSGGG